MPLENKRGSWWIAGRIALVAAAFAVLAAVFFVPQRIADQSPLALAYIKQWQAAPSQLPGTHFDKRVFEYYKFIVRTTPSRRSILAIPVDPRQRSFFAADTGPIHFTPGTQAANAESPTID